MRKVLRKYFLTTIICWKMNLIKAVDTLNYFLLPPPPEGGFFFLHPQFSRHKSPNSHKFGDCIPQIHINLVNWIKKMTLPPPSPLEVCFCRQNNISRPLHNKTWKLPLIKALWLFITEKEETLARLKIKQLYNQLTFKSEQSLACLKFVTAYTLWQKRKKNNSPPLCSW